MAHLKDQYGNAITTASDAARDAYDEGVRRLLSVAFGAGESFAAAVEADPGFALGHAAQARSLMMAGDLEAARAAIGRAEALGAETSPRERAHVGVMATLLRGDAAATRDAVRTHVRDHPRDALIAQLCTNVFGLIGFSGAVGREAELLAFTSALLPHYGEDWWMMSMHALSLCETGQIAASARLMDRALELNPDNANGAHFKAHAQYEAGETAAGRAYLGQWIAGYDRRAGLHGHLSWHLALWALQDGDIDGMWSVVDAHVGPGVGHSAAINVLTDTASICFRAGIAGVEVAPERWARLSDYAAEFFPETGQSFADMHSALAHAMAGNGDRLARIAEGATGFAGDLVRPAAAAWREIAAGNWEAALEHLVPVMAQTERLGGSRAQRDLLELAYVNVLLRLGRGDEARRSLAIRRAVLAQRPPVAGFPEH